MVTFTLKITEIEKNTPDVITIYFKQPGLKKVRYKAGQYITLIVRINGRKYIRPYSFSSAPDLDPNMSITIKRIPGGIVSNYLYDHVGVDSLLEVTQPMGDFVYDADHDDSKHIMLWGAGSGVTPLMSILKTALNKKADTRVSLFYCNRNPEHTIFFNELSDLENKFADRFKVHNFYTRLPEDVYLQYFVAGRIDELKISTILSKDAQLDKSIHYICGPDGLKTVVIEALTKLKVPLSDIYTEEFELSIDPEQFDDIETRVVKIVYDQTEYDVEVTKGTSILNAGLDLGIDLPYSCQTGSCLLCKGKLLNGKIKAIGIDNLPAELQNDDCLLCCSYPYSEGIQLLITN